MKKIKTLLTWGLLVVVTNVMGYTITVDPIEIKAGQSTNLIINLNNAESNLTAYQMNLYLPTGVTVQKNNGGYAFTASSSRHEGNFMVSVIDAADGSLFVSCISYPKVPLSGTNGELIRLPIDMASTITTSLQGSIKNIEFTPMNSPQGILHDDVLINFTMKSDIKSQQTLSLSQIPNQTYGNTYSLPTKTDQGLALTWKVKDTSVATVSGNTLKTQNVGTTTVTATQGGNDSYEAFSKEYTLTVTQAPLTVSVGNYTRQEGEDNPTFKLSYSGWKNSDTESVLTKKPTATCSATKSSPAGTYPITISGGEAKNYKLSYKNGTLTVTPKNVITITAKSYSRAYGDANPTFEYTVSGGTLTGTPKLTCTATKNSDVGTYTIKVEKGTVQGDVKLVNGTLTVTQAPLTVSVGNYTRQVGEDNPTFKLSYSGWKNGDTESVLTKKPTASCSATKSSPAGTYTITVSGGEAKNYKLNHVNGTLTVTSPSPTGIAINSTNFPDENFRKYLLGLNEGKDGVFTEAEIKQIKEIQVSKNSIKSLKGIEFFTALTKLNCFANQLSSLDVSKNTALTELDCRSNQLSSLDVSNTALTTLDCRFNQLPSLDVSKNTALRTLYCESNTLSSLDVSKNTALRTLYCQSNTLSSLDVSKNTALTDLTCYSNKLSSLDVSKNTALTWLYCFDNQLSSLDVSKNTALTDLACGSNKLSSLDVSKNTALKHLSCYYNQLSSLDVSKNTALKELWCEGNKLSSLDVSRNTALTWLDCGSNQLSSLDISKNTALTTLDCGSNQLSSLDMLMNTKLDYLCIERNNIKGTSMDAMISSLPKNTSSEEYSLYVIDNSSSNEGNVCTKAQVAAIKAKGWTPKYKNGTKWAEYFGSEETSFTITTSNAGYATFYDSQDNYSLPSGLTAQVVTGVSGGKLTYRTLTGSVVPKGTAVMLKGSGNRTYTLTSTTESASYSGTNCLRGSDNATTTTGDGYHYKLCYGSSGSSLSNVFGWYWGASNGGAFRMDGHKAWLVLPKSSTRAEGFTVEGDATSIDDLQIDDSRFDNSVYDLMGRRMNQPMRKGLYIQNGKKVIKK